MKTFWKFVVIGILGLSLLSCCTTKESGTMDNEQTKVMKKAHANQLPPGAAEISATILKIEDNYCVMKIDTVHGYGAATKPLATGTELKVLIDRIVSGNDKENLAKIFKPNSKHKMRIRFGGQGMGKKGEWEIVNIR